MKKLYLMLVASLLLTACNVNRDVEGTINGTGERITGSAKNFMDQSGNVRLDLSSGVTCEGRVIKMEGGGGSKGRLDCSDGRSGPITVIATRTGGNGFGSLDGQNYKFTFGAYN